MPCPARGCWSVPCGSSGNEELLVEEETARRTLYLSDRPGWFYTREDGYPFLPADKCFRGEGETGSGEALLQVLYGWEEDRAMVRSPQSDVEELPAWGAITVRYTCRPDQQQQGADPGLTRRWKLARGEEPDFSRIDTFAYLRRRGHGTGSRLLGAMAPPADWDRRHHYSTGQSLSGGAPEAFALGRWNGTVQETCVWRRWTRWERHKTAWALGQMGQGYLLLGLTFSAGQVDLLPRLRRVPAAGLGHGARWQ